MNPICHGGTDPHDPNPMSLAVSVTNMYGSTSVYECGLCGREASLTLSPGVAGLEPRVEHFYVYKPTTPSTE